MALLAANLGQFDPAASAATVVLALGICGLLLIAARFLVHDGEKAALITTALVLLISSYGHVIRVVEPALPTGSAPLFVSALWIAIAATWVWLIVHRFPDPHQLTRFFFTFGLLVNLFPLYAMLW